MEFWLLSLWQKEAYMMMVAHTQNITNKTLLPNIYLVINCLRSYKTGDTTHTTQKLQKKFTFICFYMREFNTISTMATTPTLNQSILNSALSIQPAVLVVLAACLVFKQRLFAYFLRRLIYSNYISLQAITYFQAVISLNDDLCVGRDQRY